MYLIEAIEEGFVIFVNDKHLKKAEELIISMYCWRTIIKSEIIQNEWVVGYFISDADFYAFWILSYEIVAVKDSYYNLYKISLVSLKPLH